MSAPYSPPWTRRGGYAHRDLRVSDAERAEVADRLSKHYSDGRLDQAEFDERVDQAMRAKTQSDLHGLFDDLPGPEDTELSAPRKGTRVAPRRRDERPHHHHHVLLFVAMIAAAFILARALVQIYVPWLLIGLIAALWLVFGPWQHHHNHRP
jgi:hypothetical protein